MSGRRYISAPTPTRGQNSYVQNRRPGALLARPIRSLPSYESSHFPYPLNYNSTPFSRSALSILTRHLVTPRNHASVTPSGRHSPFHPLSRPPPFLRKQLVLQVLTLNLNLNFDVTDWFARAPNSREASQKKCMPCSSNGLRRSV